MLNAPHQKGVMLLEALIGLLLFSIGIIAMMGLQANAMATASETKYRAEAAFIAEQFISDMRSDNAYAVRIDPTAVPPHFAAATTSGTSPYTLGAGSTPTSETSAPPTPPAYDASPADKLTYLNWKTAYTANRFYFASQNLPGASGHPPSVVVTACMRSTWTAASICPAPTNGVLGYELYGAVVEIEMKWKLPTASAGSEPRRYATAAYIMMETMP